jgi:oligopeptide/dipeptide ABC transporter ATP-binding protein
MSAADLLAVEDLSVTFHSERGAARAVRGVSLSVGAGATLALVGESGCGKSVSARAILRLHDPGSTTVAGRILLRGADILALPEGEMRRLRGSAISMIFQDPMTSLNPLMRVGDQVAEVFRVRKGMPRGKAKDASLALFARVGIADPERRFRQFPHEFSGGMLQRVMILIAAAARPLLMVADEPTTSLDVTVQAQILAMIDGLRSELGMSVLLITHDMGIVAEHASVIAVMYAGRIVESGPTAAVLAKPHHPYTEGLLDAVPRPGSRGGRLRTIEGSPPGLFTEMTPCAFAPRCRYRKAECDRETPPLVERGGGRRAACIRCGIIALRGAS